MFQRTINSAVFWSFVLAGLRIFGGMVILSLVLRILPKEELGLWYVFLSVGGLTGLFDFGFSSTMTRAVGYAWAGATKLQSMGISTEQTSTADQEGPNYQLLSQLIATMRVYYRGLAGLILLCLLTAGSWYIWCQTASLEHRMSLRAAWIFYSVSVALNTTGSLWPTLLNGINGVQQSQRLWVAGQLLNYLVTLTGLYLQWGIWALAWGQFILGVTLRVGGRFWFYQLAGTPLKDIKESWSLSLLQILWPMSWRNGLVGMAGFLNLNANTLICSAYLGLSETASYGLTLQVIGFISSLSIAWIQVKFPLIVQLRAQRRHKEIARIFSARMRLMVLSFVAASLVTYFFGNQILVLLKTKTTLLEQPLLAILLFFYLLEIHCHQFGTLIVTENKMPFLTASLLTGTGTVALSLLLVPHFGILGIILSFGLTGISYVYWWIVWRGARSIHLSVGEYWSLFFGLKVIRRYL